MILATKQLKLGGKGHFLQVTSKTLEKYTNIYIC